MSEVDFVEYKYVNGREYTELDEYLWRVSRSKRMNSEHIFSRHVRDSMRNGKFRDTVNDKFAAVHSNIFRVLGARGIGDYLDRQVPEGGVPLPLHIHKSFADRTAESLSPAG